MGAVGFFQLCNLRKLWYNFWDRYKGRLPNLNQPLDLAEFRGINVAEIRDFQFYKTAESNGWFGCGVCVFYMRG